MATGGMSTITRQVQGAGIGMGRERYASSKLMRFARRNGFVLAAEGMRNEHIHFFFEYREQVLLASQLSLPAQAGCEVDLVGVSMIARVRIAPVERWCELPKGEPEWFVTAGRTVEIHTDDMRTRTTRGGEMFREWPMTVESTKVFSELTGIHCAKDERLFVCEHLLEMD